MTLTRCPVFKYFWKNYREIQGQLEVTEKETLLLYTIYKAIATKNNIIHTNTQDTTFSE